MNDHENKTLVECLAIWTALTIGGLAGGGAMMAIIMMWVSVPICFAWINYRMFGHPLRIGANYEPK